MTDDNHILFPCNLGRWITILVGSPWLERSHELWKRLRKVVAGMGEEGMYEVFEYESTLELLDRRGARAHVRKHEKVRYLQNSIIAYQDQAWGDGDILKNYRCTPGVPVDRYRPSKTTYVLISLRAVRNRGDEDEFNIDWEMRNSFLRNSELWEAQVNHRMKRLRIEVIFPRERPPLRAWLVENSTQKARPLGEAASVALPGGRRLVYWETLQPRRYETYGLKWQW